MRLALGLAIGALTIFFVFIIQEFIPPIHGLRGARVLLIPMVFCYAAMVLPTWAMLLFATFTGLVTDLMYLHIVDGQVEIGLGWSIVFFVLFGLFAHGFQPAFLNGKWWLHVLLSALGTCLFLALQYVMICFRRQGIVFNETVVWRILAPGLIAAVFAPLVHLLVVQYHHFFPDLSPTSRFRPRR